MRKSAIRWLLAGLLLSLLVLSSCASRSSPEAMPAPAPRPVLPPTASKDLVGSAPSGVVAAGGNYSQAASDRMVIKTADVDIVVKDFSETVQGISALANRLGGYTVSSYVVQKTDNAVSSITIRVPSAKMDEALQAIKALSIEVKTLNTNSSDITEQFSDLQSQLRNLQAAEAQYLEIMKKATTVDDILKVQSQLTNIRGQIESVQGRIKYLQGNVEESRISVTMRLTAEAKPVVTSGWSIVETLRSAARGLIDFGKVILDIAVWLAIFSPVWVGIGAAVYFGRRRMLRKKG